MIDTWKTRIYVGKVYTNFCGLNVPEDDIKYQSFTVISIDFLLFWKQILPASIFRQLCLTNCKKGNDRLFW